MIKDLPAAKSRGEDFWPRHRHQILDWLVNETHTERYIDNIFVELCARLNNARVPVERATLHFRTYHPQWYGARIVWLTGMSQASLSTFAYGVEKTPDFLFSPAFEIYQGVREVRHHLAHPPFTKPWPLLSDLAGEGFTDYVAWPIDHTLGEKHFVSYATRAAGGFTPEQVSLLRDLTPPLALVSEIRLKNVLARTLLETYVGPRAGSQILAGATTRGSGATLSAAIMICDLRDFTHISDLWPRDEVIGMLNSYFDAICEPIERNGGEILKFLGDGLLAVFPLSHSGACAELLKSICEAKENMARLSESNSLKGLPELAYGIGVHLGDVMYGNIGSSKRLDFTVIGPAVNVASRLENLTKEVGKSVLVSSAFADAAKCHEGLERVGVFPLKGLGDPIEVFALVETRRKNGEECTLRNDNQSSTG